MRAWSERIMTEPKTMASAWLLTITIDEGYPGLSKPQNQNATATQMFTTLDGKIAASSGLESLLATAQLATAPCCGPGSKKKKPQSSALGGCHRVSFVALW